MSDWQPDLFDAHDLLARAEPERYEIPEADQYAFLWTATEAGNTTGIRFMATVEDAQKWCSSDLSRGNLHGTDWAYFWTTVANYVRRWGHEHLLDPQNFGDFIDDGSWDERIASTGCRPIKSAEARQILAGMGLELMAGAA